ncbi:VOC family protein [Kribbella sp. NPDC023972]|uniref:VOC family protein n=1 Tax=Kribbella sp. NPDC023972 TaxID=3154795 RepID=UPI00340475C1
MTSQLHALCFDANDPPRLARFWAGVLDWETEQDAVTLRPTDDTGFLLRFLPTGEPKTVPNQMHFDLTSQSLEHQQQTVAKSLDLGARHIDIGQRPEEGHVVLADPEGNEFCVLPPGNKFLADCGFLGAIASDGSQAVGYFWSKALAWPLVWDQDEETAIRSPHGGPKITWGGSPVAPKPAKNRLHFDLTPSTDPHLELNRLISLGATSSTTRQCDPTWIPLTDPDGNEFCLRTP